MSITKQVLSAILRAIKSKFLVRTVGLIGDSTFIHSGITGLIDIVYNKGTSTIVIADNSTKIIGKNSVNDMLPIMHKALEKANITATNVDLMLTHQPAHWVYGAWRDAIGVAHSKSYETYSKYGNLASTSIPISLYEARKLGKINDGDMLLLVSSGAGENFAASVLKWRR